MGAPAWISKKWKVSNFCIKAWSRWHTPVSVYVILCHYLTLHYDTEIWRHSLDLLWCWQLSVVLGTISDYLKAVSLTVSRVQAIDHHMMFEMLHPVSCVWLSPIFIDIISHQSELGQAVWAGLMKSDINWISNTFFVASAPRQASQHWAGWYRNGENFCWAQSRNDSPHPSPLRNVMLYIVHV